MSSKAVQTHTPVFSLSNLAHSLAIRAFRELLGRVYFVAFFRDVICTFKDGGRRVNVSMAGFVRERI